MLMAALTSPAFTTVLRDKGIDPLQLAAQHGHQKTGRK
jgi:hypothetical protein